MRAPLSDPMSYTTLKNAAGEPMINLTRRTGAPRFIWAIEAAKDAAQLRQDILEPPDTDFNTNDCQHWKDISFLAQTFHF